MRWDLVVPAMAALAAAGGCGRAAARSTSRRARAAWHCQAAAGALWVLAAAGWMAGLGMLADVGRVGFLGLTAVRLWLACPGPAGRARMLLGGGICAAGAAVLAWSPMAYALRADPARTAFPVAGLALSVFAGFVALRVGERGMPGWSCAGLLAIALADLDAGRGGGSAGLGWLLGFGCLAMATYPDREPAWRRVLAGVDDQLRLADDLRDLPGPGPSPYRNPRPGDRRGSPRPGAGQPADPLGVSGGALYESKRVLRRR